MVMNTGKYTLYSMEIIFSEGRDPAFPENSDDENDLCSLQPHNHMRLRWNDLDNIEPPFEMFITEIPETDEWKVNQPYTDDLNKATYAAWFLNKLFEGNPHQTLPDGSEGIAIDPTRLIEALGQAKVDTDERKKKESDYAGGLYL